MTRRLLLIGLVALAVGAAQPVAERGGSEEAAARAAQREAEAAHEAAAQKALTDSLTDALAMLKHGSARAKEEAANGIAQMAIETTISQPFHPVTFRNACVRAGILPELVALLKTPYSTSTAGGGGPLHALRALEAIATDDPNTELDNGHALATCEAGALPPSVKLLSSLDEPIQVAAAGLAAVLAENPQCQTMLLKAGAVPPLVRLGSFGGDGAKLRALAALDLLALNHPAALQAIANSGGRQLLEGVRRYGGETLKGLTAELLDGLDAPSKQTVTVDTAAHARQAHQARLKHSKVWQSASQPVRRAMAPGQHPEQE